MLAWSSWLATLLQTRPLSLAVLVDGAAYALVFPLGYATIGLVLTLRRPANPIGWLYAAAGLVGGLAIPLDPWVDRLVRVAHGVRGPVHLWRWICLFCQLDHLKRQPIPDYGCAPRSTTRPGTTGSPTTVTMAGTSSAPTTTVATVTPHSVVRWCTGPGP
jgi:hypothetical protein